MNLWTGNCSCDGQSWEDRKRENGEVSSGNHLEEREMDKTGELSGM